MDTLYNKVALQDIQRVVGTGWLPSMPDMRDYTLEHKEIKKIAEQLGLTDDSNPLPSSIDLRKWCSPVEDQLHLGSCTAQAGMGIVEYLERRAYGKHIDGSRLFLYKTTRNLMQLTGDTGATIRTTMGALALCGVPGEKYWPYTDDPNEFDKEPPAFIYSIADNYEAIKYFSFDSLGANVKPQTVLENVKMFLAAGIPIIFGFYGFPSFDKTDVEGGIPFPCEGESAQWGHALVAVGYNDGIKIKNTQCNKETKGALLIRNSWGTAWGEDGYGWIPYDYALNRLAFDFWSLFKMEYIDTKQFGI
jgi:C1A family cysteine protease